MGSNGMEIILVLYMVHKQKDISDKEPNLEEFPDAMPLFKDENKEQEKNKDKVPTNEKSGNYKDTKEYTFTTQGLNGTGPEITLRATTDVNFVLRNSQANTEKSTTKSTENLTENPIGEITTAEDTIKEPLEVHDYQIQKPTKSQNEPEFWTMLEKALNATPPREVNKEEKDQLFNPIPSSDENYLTKETLGELEDIKLKLMLGISLMSLILFLALLTLCFATLYKLRTLSKHECESQYSVNPELAEMSYFHPTEGVSDTSFSKSAESSTFWGNNSSELRKLGIKKSKSKSVTNMLSDDADAYEGMAEEEGEDMAEEAGEDTAEEAGETTPTD